MVGISGIAAHGNDGNPQFQGIGVLASGESMGVQASSASGTGVSATSGSGYGVSATSTTGVGLHAVGGGATGSATPPYAQAEHP